MADDAVSDEDKLLLLFAFLGTRLGMDSMDHVNSPSGITSGTTSPVDSFLSLQGTNPSAKKYLSALSANGR